MLESTAAGGVSFTPRHATYLAYTAPGAGQVFPLVPGLLALRERGHDVHLRTAPDLVAAIRRVGLAVEPVDPRIRKPPFEDHAGERSPSQAAERLLIEQRDLERAAAETRPHALLVDAGAHGAVTAAPAARIPWALTLPSLLQSQRARRSQLEAFAAPNRVLVLAGEPLEHPPDDIPGHVRLVGAQLWDPPAPFPGDLSYLEVPGDPWVLVGCSTPRQAGVRLATTAIDALRDEPVRVIVTRPDVGGLRSATNIRVESFVPHSRVLEHAAVVVCSGGVGLVQKAVAAGVPLVIVPLGGDQPEIARRVVELEAGVRISPECLSSRRLRVAVRDAMVGRGHDRGAASRLRASGSPEAFADVAEELLRECWRTPTPPQHFTGGSPTHSETGIRKQARLR
jgi:UDP:flavonoid glycosyltransferase YjiC (YdhE family)